MFNVVKQAVRNARTLQWAQSCSYNALLILQLLRPKVYNNLNEKLLNSKVFTLRKIILQAYVGVEGKSDCHWGKDQNNII